jgi:hypothetical protein
MAANVDKAENTLHMGGWALESPHFILVAHSYWVPTACCTLEGTLPRSTDYYGTVYYGKRWSCVREVHSLL